MRAGDLIRELQKVDSDVDVRVKGLTMSGVIFSEIRHVVRCKPKMESGKAVVVETESKDIDLVALIL